MRWPLSFWIIRLFVWLFGWLVHPLLWLRTRAGKEDPNRRKERFGKTSAARPDGKLVWIHGASLGEISLGLRFAQEVLVQHPDLHFLFTCQTRTALDLMQNQNLPCQVQVLPVDTPASTKRFIDHWRPDTGIFFESEIWPNLLYQCAKQDIPLGLVNARMNQKSRQNWLNWLQLAKALFGCFSQIHAADQITAETLEQIIGQKISAVGNLKLLAAQTKPANASKTIKPNNQIWLASSTHLDDELSLLQAQKLILQTWPNAMLILVPRHPERGPQILQMAKDQNLNGHLLSDSNGPKPPLFIADSIGEMDKWHALSQAAFIGGSLGGGKGHTPIEAVRANIPILSGKAVVSFAEMYQGLTDINAVDFVETPKDIAEIITGIFEDPMAKQQQSMAAKNWLTDQQQNLRNHVLLLANSLLSEKPNAST